MSEKALHDKPTSERTPGVCELKPLYAELDHSLDNLQKNAYELTSSNAEALCQNTEKAKELSLKVIDKLKSGTNSVSGSDLYNSEVSLMTALDKLEQNSLRLRSPAKAPVEQIEAQKPLCAELQSSLKMAKQSLKASVSKLKDSGADGRGTGYGARIEGNFRLELLRDAVLVHESLDQAAESADRLAISNQVPWTLQKAVDQAVAEEDKRVLAERTLRDQAEREHLAKIEPLVFEKDVIATALGLQRDHDLVFKGFHSICSETSADSLKGKPYRSESRDSGYGSSPLGMAIDEGGALGALMTVQIIASPFIIVEGLSALGRCFNRERVPNPYYVSHEKRDRDIQKQQAVLQSFCQHLKTIRQEQPETVYDRLPQETVSMVKEIFDTLPQMQSIADEGQALLLVPAKRTSKAYKEIHGQLQEFLDKEDRPKLNETWVKSEDKLRRRYEQLEKELDQLNK